LQHGPLGVRLRQSSMALQDTIERQAALRAPGVRWIGVDVVCIANWERRLKLGGDALLNRVYTESELEFAAGRPERLATRLAAKEAVLKALGTGFKGVGFKTVEVKVDDAGKPMISLTGTSAQRARQLGLEGFAISLCHEDGYAIAIAAGSAARTM